MQIDYAGMQSEMFNKTEQKIEGIELIDWMNFFVTSCLIFGGFSCLLVWFGITPSLTLSARLASKENELLRSMAVKVDIKGKFQQFAGTPSLLKGEWGGFRGALHDNINLENIALVDSFNKGNLPILWSVKLGEGYAGAAVKNGRVFVLDYDKATYSDALRCFSFDDGQEIWRRSYKIKTKRNHGISRTVPAVTDKSVVTIGPKCQVMCVDAASGDFKWGIDLPTEYDTKVPLWYTGQCPLIDDSVAIIAPAGKSLIIGVECETGRKLWEIPNPDNFKMSHSSIIPMTFHGKKMYVYAAIGGMVGVSAEPADKGKLLWKTTEWNHSVVSPSPVKVSNDRVFVTAGYGNGSMMFRVTKGGQEFGIEKLFQLGKEKFACEQHTPIFYRDHLFSILPNDSGDLNRQLVCMKPDGTRAWSSGKENRFGLGPFIIADGKVFILSDEGVLTIAEASTSNFKKLDEVKVLSGPEAWGPLAIADGRMLLRDLEEMKCLDLRKTR